ncbi:MAG: hypothetical protein H6607_00435 [Flavobacteriales bacterium]|nr:hypothetical protein [Flavobacteriales bacterium]
MQIKNPCPASIARMKKQGNSFYCKGCQKFVVDFRDKSNDEIKEIIGYGGCGIFRNDQLINQKRYGGWGQAVFYALMVLSFVGFSVKPMKAEATEILNPTETVCATKDASLSNEKPNPWRWPRFLRRKGRQVMGKIRVIE